jgi:DNA-binding HxlR family transcriptional regulator
LKEAQTSVVMDGMKCCPIDNTFKIIGKKFAIHILRNMTQLNQTRFNQFLDSIEGINPKSLSRRLREMEQDKLIEKKVFPGTPVRIEYFMTEKGESLKPILEQMAAFSIKYCAKDVFKDGKPRDYKAVYGKSPQTVK